MRATQLRNLVAALAAACVVSAASAQIVPIGPFVGDRQEGFETQTRGQFLPSYDVFDDTAIVEKLGAGSLGLHITTSWGFFCTVRPNGGEVFMGGPSDINANWIFDTPAQRFGGYFSTNADTPGGRALLYDENNNLLADMPIQAPLCSWAWDGWETTGPGIKRVEIIASNRFNCHLMHDDMECTTMGDDCDPCDMNCDGVVDAFDIEPFLDLLFGGGEPCAPCTGDVDGNGEINAFDIEPFLECLFP